MPSGAKTETREQSMQNCLDQMDALAGELRQAMGAIAGNTLASLEESVRRQGERSAVLQLALSRLQVGGDLPGSVSTLFAWSSRFRKAAQALWKLNEEYAALLEHSESSLRMLRALHGQSPVPEGSLQLAGNGCERHQMWSWEG
jgi:hypothetical protein